MKKSILNLGKTLNRSTQKQINGGSFGACLNHCWDTYGGGGYSEALCNCERACSNDNGGLA